MEDILYGIQILITFTSETSMPKKVKTTKLSLDITIIMWWYSIYR